MALARPDFGSLSASDIQELIDDGVPESAALDYKAGMYGGTDADKKELLKDVSAFANTNGGHLLIGVTEDAGVPTGMPGIPLADPDAEVLRVESLIRDGIEPRLIGVHTKSIGVAAGQFVVAIRVPKSWSPPHRVCFKGTNRIWLRNSAGTHEASMEELRHLFGFGVTLSESIRAFRAERTRLLRNGEGPRKLLGGGQLVVHLLPFASFTSPLQIDLARAHKNHVQFPVIGNLGMSPRINFDGVIMTSGGADDKGYTQIFRNGIVEATVGELIFQGPNGRPCIAGMKLERELIDALGKHIAGLRLLDVPAPLAVAVTLQGARGAIYAVEQHSFEPRVLDRDLLELPICVIENYGTDDEYVRAVRPAFDALWNAVGYMRDEYFNANGQWVGRP